MSELRSMDVRGQKAEISVLGSKGLDLRAGNCDLKSLDCWQAGLGQEDRGQRSGADFARFLRFSLNSSSELEYHLIAARDLQALHQQQVAPVIEKVIEIRRMLYGLLRYLESRPKASRPSTQRPGEA